MVFTVMFGSTILLRKQKKTKRRDAEVAEKCLKKEFAY